MTGVDGNSHRFYVLISPPSLQYLGRTPCEPRHLVYPLPHFSFGPHKLLPPEYPQNLTRSGKTILLSLCPSTQQAFRFGRHGPCLQRSLPTQSPSRGSLTDGDRPRYTQASQVDPTHCFPSRVLLLLLLKVCSHPSRRWSWRRSFLALAHLAPSSVSFLPLASCHNNNTKKCDRVQTMS